MNRWVVLLVEWAGGRAGDGWAGSVGMVAWGEVVWGRFGFVCLLVFLGYFRATTADIILSSCYSPLSPRITPR